MGSIFCVCVAFYLFYFLHGTYAREEYGPNCDTEALRSSEIYAHKRTLLCSGSIGIADVGLTYQKPHLFQCIFTLQGKLQAHVLPPEPKMK